MMGSLLKCTFLCQTHNFFLRASFCMKKFSRGLINLNPRMSSKICLIIPKTTCLKREICDWQYNKQYPSLITINLAIFSPQSLSIHSVLSSRPLLMMANKELALELAEEEKHYFIFVHNENKWKHRRMQTQYVPSLSSDKLDCEPSLLLCGENTRARER